MQSSLQPCLYLPSGQSDMESTNHGHLRLLNTVKVVSSGQVAAPECPTSSNITDILVDSAADYAAVYDSCAVMWPALTMVPWPCWKLSKYLFAEDRTELAPEMNQKNQADQSLNVEHHRSLESTTLE